MLRYFDAVVWEYLVTTSAETVEKLIGTICEKATTALSCDRASAAERTQYWTTNAREREANGIVGKRILVRIDPPKAVVFRKLAIRFRELLGSGPDLQVVFGGGGRSFIYGGTDEAEVRGHLNSQFIQISDDATAALGFRFSDSSWLVFYWLDILRQESHPPVQSRLVQLYKSSAEFCDELETRAQKALAVVPPDDGPVSTRRSIGVHLGDWTELEICFLSDERVQIHRGASTETLNYAEFGFADGRTKNANSAWLALRNLAIHEGTIPRVLSRLERIRLEKQMQSIRKTLRKRFKLNTDPLPFTRGIGYRAMFKITCGPSFNS
jgi:hypothetical protein